MAQIAAIATALTEIFTLGYKVWNLIREAKEKGWVKDGMSLAQQISEAKTNEERMALARKLYEHGPQ